jgi:hypothetical protein
MKHELTNYEVFPKILPADKSSTITIRPLGLHAAFDPNALYLVRFIPMDQSIEPLEYDQYPSITTHPEAGVLRFSHMFSEEQEHYIKVFKLPETETPLGTFRVFSLKPDLYALKPYRGDFHVHTCRSDGQESPAIVAANFRRHGFDFLAITDHHKWYPSQEAMDAYKDAPIDLGIFHGEEIHATDNHIHIVNFGGSYSVNELFENDDEKYRREVHVIMNNTTVPHGVNAFEYASSVWCFDRVREAGGLAIFCHPYWIPNAYHVPQKMVDLLFERKPFDAFEVIGGHEVYSNNMQTAYYNEARAKGMTIPIVGSSDAHGTEDEYWFDWFSTIVFAKDPERDSIISAVKGLYSVAVECYPGEAFRLYGPYRMVKYAQFLMYEYFPLHHALCFEEGRQMKEYACGDESAVQKLSVMHGRTAALLERCYRG